MHLYNVIHFKMLHEVSNLIFICFCKDIVKNKLCTTDNIDYAIDFVDVFLNTLSFNPDNVLFYVFPITVCLVDVFAEAKKIASSSCSA